jgi:hypothetical protein
MPIVEPISFVRGVAVHAVLDLKLPPVTAIVANPEPDPIAVTVVMHPGEAPDPIVSVPAELLL